MKFYLNTLFLICLSFLMIGCSSMNDWDVSKIIDKTERWLFDDVEDDSDEKVEVEEVFTDINDVPQIKPEFEEIDENFFESESKEIESKGADDDNVEVSQVNKKDNIKIENELENKNISAVLEVRKNISGSDLWKAVCVLFCRSS